MSCINHGLEGRFQYIILHVGLDMVIDLMGNQNWSSCNGRCRQVLVWSVRTDRTCSEVGVFGTAIVADDMGDYDVVSMMK